MNAARAAATAALSAAQKWADRLNIVQRSCYSGPGDMVSHAYADGTIADISIDVEADDDYGRRLVSVDGRMAVHYNESAGSWFGV